MKNVLLLCTLLLSFWLAPAHAHAQGTEGDAAAGAQAPADEAAKPDALARLAEDAKKGLEKFMADPAGEAKDWLMTDGVAWLGKIALVLLILLAARIAGAILAGIVRRALSTSKLRVSDLLRNFATNLTRNVVLFLGFLVALSTIGISIGPFLAAFGVVGFVVGFALQDTMGNFAAGVMILLYRPFDVGDFVTAGGVTGKVNAMTLVSTTMRTGDNQTIIVPNGKIWGGTITNVTANPTRRVDLTAGIGYEDDIEKAEQVLARIVKEHELVHDDPEPVIRLHELAESSVNFVVRVWANTSDYWDVYWDLTRSIKMEFDREGISIPFPQRDVHLHEARRES